MNNEIKRLLINTILEVVDSAPNFSKGIYQRGLSKEEFDIWIKYVYSVLNIFADTIPPTDYLEIRKKIRDIANEDNNEYVEELRYVDKTIKICNLLLNFAEQYI